MTDEELELRAEVEKLRTEAEKWHRVVLNQRADLGRKEKYHNRALRTIDEQNRQLEQLRAFAAKASNDKREMVNAVHELFRVARELGLT